MALQIEGPAMMPAANDDPAAIGLPIELGGRVRGPMQTSTSSLRGNGACMLAEAVEAWVRLAPAGAELVYAHGYLPQWAKAPARLRHLATLGLVALTQDHKAKDYIAQRTAAPWPAVLPQPHRIARIVQHMDPHAAELFDMLDAWAEKGVPCRGNVEIAEALGLSSAKQVSYLFRILVKEGLILNRPARYPTQRVITIVRTGKSTGARNAS